MTEVGCGVTETLGATEYTEYTSLEAGRRNEPDRGVETVATEQRRRVNSSITAAATRALKTPFLTAPSPLRHLALTVQMVAEPCHCYKTISAVDGKVWWKREKSSGSEKREPKWPTRTADPEPLTAHCCYTMNHLYCWQELICLTLCSVSIFFFFCKSVYLWDHTMVHDINLSITNNCLFSLLQLWIL